jgi:hypothetical protein
LHRFKQQQPQQPLPITTTTTTTTNKQTSVLVLSTGSTTRPSTQPQDMGYSAPSKLGSWEQQYFVIGGAVAKPNVLQLYGTKADYEEVNEWRRLMKSIMLNCDG